MSADGGPCLQRMRPGDQPRPVAVSGGDGGPGSGVPPRSGRAGQDQSGSLGVQGSAGPSLQEGHHTGRQVPHASSNQWRTFYY